MDFVAETSCGTNIESFGEAQLIKDVGSIIRDLDVIVVEEFFDTGLTADYLLRNFGLRKPASLKTCVLLSKPSWREVEVPIDYLGFEIPDEFVEGYGLDYGEEYRNLPFIAVLTGDGQTIVNDRSQGLSSNWSSRVDGSFAIVFYSMQFHEAGMAFLNNGCASQYDDIVSVFHHFSFQQQLF